MKNEIKEELAELLPVVIKYKKYLEDKKSNIQLFQIYTALNTIIFWLEVILK